MIENSIEDFSEELIKFLTGQSKVSRSLLVKKHSERLQTHGDFSFPNSVKSWHEYFICSQETNKSLLEYLEKETSSLIEESKNWHLNVLKTVVEKDRVFLFLNRPKAITLAVKEATNNNNILTRILQTPTETNNVNVFCDNSSGDSDCLTSLRVKYLRKSIENLYLIAMKHSKHKLPEVVLTSKSSYKRDNGLTLLCGAVLNIKTGGKETNIKAEDYIRIRQNEMTLIAQHKYGVRVATDDKWKEFVAHLGESAVKFELLQTKPCSAIKVNFDCSSAGSSKGAAFILYNCARLEAIIRSYNEKVNEGTYPPLPDIDDTDLSLLTHEDEWNLIFNFILGFPSLLENCVEINENTCEFRQHHICSFLCSMVRVFSQYYRKTRILTEPRKHLLPVLFARVHMLTVLNNTLKMCLTILDIKSVSQMYFYGFIYSSFLCVFRKLLFQLEILIFILNLLRCYHIFLLSYRSAVKFIKISPFNDNFDIYCHYIIDTQW